jgi:hypothetical protein
LGEPLGLDDSHFQCGLLESYEVPRDGCSTYFVSLLLAYHSVESASELYGAERLRYSAEASSGQDARPTLVEPSKVLSLLSGAPPVLWQEPGEALERVALHVPEEEDAVQASEHV